MQNHILLEVIYQAIYKVDLEILISEYKMSKTRSRVVSARPVCVLTSFEN